MYVSNIPVLNYILTANKNLEAFTESFRGSIVFLVDTVDFGRWATLYEE